MPQRNALPNQRSTGSMIFPRSFNDVATRPDHWQSLCRTGIVCQRFRVGPGFEERHDARDRMMHGIDTLAHAVRVTRSSGRRARSRSTPAMMPRSSLARSWTRTPTPSAMTRRPASMATWCRRASSTRLRSCGPHCRTPPPSRVCSLPRKRWSPRCRRSRVQRCRVVPAILILSVRALAVHRLEGLRAEVDGVRAIRHGRRVGVVRCAGSQRGRSRSGTRDRW
jgi:hypothetical protein